MRTDVVYVIECDPVCFDMMGLDVQECLVLWSCLSELCQSCTVGVFYVCFGSNTGKHSFFDGLIQRNLVGTC